MSKSEARWLKKGQALARRGRYSEALVMYTQALSLAPDDALLHHHLGYVLNELERYQEALAATTRASSLNPQLVPASCNHAYAALGLRKYDVAYREYLRATFLLADQPGASYNLRQTPINHKPLGDMRELPPKDMHNRAIHAYQAQGYVLTQVGLHEAAWHAFAHATHLARQVEMPLRQQAMLYVDQGTALLQLKRYNEALAAFIQAFELDPTYATISYDAGYTLNALGRHAEAVAAFDRAIELDPRFAPAHNDRACSLLSLQRYAEALASAEEAIRLAPELAYTYDTKGDALFELERYVEALAAFEQAIARDPNDSNYQQHHEKTLQVLRRAVEGEQP